MQPMLRMERHPTLSPEARQALRCLIGLIIPASARHGVPGADDERIFADILDTLAPQTARITETLAALDALAGGSFTAQSREQQMAAADSLRAGRPPGLTAIVNATGQCYYRDERVMLALGMEARPPFPKGHDLEQGDWSLLDPVRARAPFYRRTD